MDKSFAPVPYVLVMVIVGRVLYPVPDSCMNTLAIAPFSELVREPSSITILSDTVPKSSKTSMSVSSSRKLFSSVLELSVPSSII